MTDSNPAPAQKRARLFGRGPFPGLFSLDTSNDELPLEFFQQAFASCTSTSSRGNERCKAASTGTGTTRSLTHSSLTLNGDDGFDSPPSQTTAPTERSKLGSPASTEAAAVGTITPAPARGRETRANAGDCVAGVVVADEIGVVACTAFPAATDTTPAQQSIVTTRSSPSDGTGGVRRSEHTVAPTPGVLPASAGSDDKFISMDEDVVAPAPGSSAPAAMANGGTTAASVVASFLKRGSTALPPRRAAMPSSTGTTASLSPPKTPTSLASLITGLPPGSGGSSAARSSSGSASSDRRRVGDSAPNTAPPRAVGTDSCIQSVRRGGTRFLHNEWPRILKKRRRILHFPRPSDPDGSRILYWVRGNYRVKDNLGLSVALWLSTELQLPLQAVTFVDPAIGRVGRMQGGDGAHRDVERQELSFRMAVEASALCEMEEALRALNVPLVAIDCDEGKIPSALACWCSGSRGNGPGSGSGQASARALPASVSQERSPMEENVHITIMDESYHPSQLLLSDKVKDALRGTGALYAVDSSCVYPVNTSGGGAQAGAGVGSGGATGILSPVEFRHAQVVCLPAVLADLMPRPRVPLCPHLQKQMFVGGRRRAILPREFQHGAGSSRSSAVAVDWDKLRELSAGRFPGFGKPILQQLASSDKDLISVLGGGERVGETSLRQALNWTAASGPEGQRSAGAGAGSCPHPGCSVRVPPSQEQCARLECEAAGLGFGGCLLHLLRLGSLTSLSVVQALFGSTQYSGAGGDQVDEQFSKLSEPRRRLLDEVLSREYALYRSRLYHQELSRSVGSSVGVSTPKRHKEWGKDSWMGIVPAWVWEELRKGQRDARKQQHNPEDIRLAGSTEPSTVHDQVFSAIQARLTTGARLHSSLAPYWARAVVKMMLVPSQAVSLLIHLAEEFCLGAAHAGDVVPDLLDSAFGVLREPPPPPTATSGMVATNAGEARISSPGRAVAGTRREMSIFRRLYHSPLATEEGLQSAFGGEGALARFLVAKVPTLSE